MGIGGRLHEEQAAFATTSGIGRSMPILDTPIDLQHGLIVPAVIAGLGGEMIPVVLMASGPDHHIDARAATQNLAHSHWNGTSVQSWIWLGSEASLMLASSSLPPASSRRTLTSAFSASRRATTDPDDPEPQTMKS